MKVCNAQFANKMMKQVFPKGFSEDVDDLVLRGDMDWHKKAGAKFFTYIMTINLYMFCMLMKDWIVCNVECNLIITIKDDVLGM